MVSDLHRISTRPVVTVPTVTHATRKTLLHNTQLLNTAAHIAKRQSKFNYLEAFNMSIE